MCVLFDHHDPNFNREDFISFLEEALENARAYEDLCSPLRSANERVAVDVKFSNIESIIIHLKKTQCG